MTITLTMEDHRITTLSEVEQFVNGTSSVVFSFTSRKEKYAWVQSILVRFRYHRLRKKERGAVKQFIRKVTGYSPIQIKRLVKQYRKTKKVALSAAKKHRFPVVYTTEDVALLAQTDNAHLRLSGPATKRICEREYGVFGKRSYERLSRISVSHLYNLRGRRQYVSHATTYTKTTAVATPIGERRKPYPEGKPGFIRVDSVHQGDQDKAKGVYHVNLVDEVTQWEIVVCVEGISEYFLAGALEVALAAFPFPILNFHSDNGSEYINYTVARLLTKLHVEQTKSRSRHTNDNALVESKNGSIVRKHFGYRHIPRRYAGIINAFYQSWFNRYLNYHRPCGFATTMVDAKGKERKIYDVYLTPYEKLKALPAAATYLNPGISFGLLDTTATEMSDTDYAILMQKHKAEVYQKLSR